MSIDIADKGRYVFYLNFRTQGTGDNFCEAEQNFNFAELIDNAGKYVLSVERWRIPIQAIPMFPATNQAVSFYNDLDELNSVHNFPDLFSIGDLIKQVNDINKPVLVGDPPVEEEGFFMTLTASGKVQINHDFTNNQIRFDPAIARLFGMDLIIGSTLTGPQTIIGNTPIFDRFDQLFKVQIEGLSGLSSVQQEIIDTNVFRNLLTDFIVPSNFTMSLNNTPGKNEPDTTYNIGYPVRQDLEFNQAANRRFIMFRGNSPIQNVRIEVTAIYRDGTRHRIRMPDGTILEVKVAFWRK